MQATPKTAHNYTTKSDTECWAAGIELVQKRADLVPLSVPVYLPADNPGLHAQQQQTARQLCVYCQSMVAKILATAAKATYESERTQLQQIDTQLAPLLAEQKRLIKARDQARQDYNRYSDVALELDNKGTRLLQKLRTSGSGTDQDIIWLSDIATTGLLTVHRASVRGSPLADPSDDEDNIAQLPGASPQANAAGAPVSLPTGQLQLMQTKEICLL